MAVIEAVIAREILDSRGNPRWRSRSASTTVRWEGQPSPAAHRQVPSRPPRSGTAGSGTSAGRAGGRGRGRRRHRAGGRGLQASEQRLIDQLMIDLDATPTRTAWGRTRSWASPSRWPAQRPESADLPLFRYLGGPASALCCRSR